MKTKAEIRTRIRKLRASARILESNGLIRPGQRNIYDYAADELEWVLKDNGGK